MQYSKNQQQQDISMILNSQTAVDLQLRHFKGEAFSDSEKQTFLSIVKILSVIFFLFSIPITGLSVYYFSIIKSYYFIFVIVAGACMILLGIAVFEWGKTTSLRIFKNQNSIQKSQLASNRFSQYVFISSITIAMLNTIIILYLYNWVVINQSIYTAQFGPSQFQNFKQNYQLCMLVIWALVVINQVILLAFIYYEFIITIGLYDLRLLAHYFNVFLTGFSLTCVHACKKAESYFTLYGMSEYANKNVLNIVYMISLGQLAICIFNYIVIVRKKRQEYMWIGTVLIFISCFLSAYNHLIYRDAQNILEGYMNTWYQQMPYVSNQYMQNEMQCNKYITKDVEGENVYSLHCDLDYQTLVWEDNYNLKVGERLYQTACLNQDCKGVLAQSYSAWYYRINLLFFCQILSQFIIASIFYQISLVMSRKKHGMDNVDYFFGFCTILVIGSVLTYIFNYDFTEPPQLNAGNMFFSHNLYDQLN
ncbi:transmembrane protein, putative (macronuclear) [Tetrahymena thermophila SB210]|uniref:Transmembrane protein, putative n=1 Tax=Tetrahymena thermophila (strain SB210) TaxID=312017 RepID=I7MN43_TETTS|nr:transmembrane protein, putative [Tetrahymena thermophila SB210]EAS07882.2 transmembrane protein, putative [Tetrahymena thermophila SB210]|eukprot:XP_001028124.2 transmembrane protein, putative [Tetrahymena thermophila SB210]